MPSLDSVPFPGQVPIQRADWGAPVGNAMGQAAAAVGAPVNALTQANDIQSQMARNNALTGQTANAVQDLQQKQRQFQVSMLNGVLALPEEQQGDALSKVVPMMNRMGPTQFDESMTPSTAKMYVMSTMPADQMPMYQMNAAKAAMFSHAAQQQGAGQQGAPQVSAPQTPSAGGQAGTPMPTGTPMPGSGSAPIPQGGGAPLPPNSPLLTDPYAPLYDPAGVAAAKAQQDAFYSTPQGKLQTTQAETEGKNTAENQLGAAKAEQLTQRLQQNLEAMLKLNPDVPYTGVFSGDQAVRADQAIAANPWWNFLNKDAPAAVDAAKQWDQINNQQVISEIQQFINTAGAGTRTNQTLEKIVKAASSVDKDAPPATRQHLIQNALAEIQNKNISAENLAGAKQPYSPIPVNTGQQGGTQSQRIPVITPDGRPGTIDPAHLNDLIAAGGKRI